VYFKRAVVIAFSGLLIAPAWGAGYAAPLQAGYGQDRGGWDTPPSEFREIERQGFRDGIGSAHRDFDKQRRPDVDRHDEFRNPPVTRDQWEPYRRGFKRGYELAVSHLWGSPQAPENVAPPPPPPPHQFRDDDRGAPRPGDEIRQRGFQDGMLGALKDLINSRRPDPENRDEFRNPGVPYPMQEPYRDGFRRGYHVAIDEISGSDFRDMARGPGGEIRQRGYRDGFAGAIKDFGNNRQPDPNNRDEYRSPNVPYPAQDAYRDGFRRGYQRATAQLQGAPWRH